MVDILGIWIAALLTLCIFSFLFKDNPFYRFAEHVFIGVSAGYYVAFYSWTILWPKLFRPIFSGEDLILIIVLVMGLMTFGKLTQRYKWTSRWPIAFVVGCTVGLAIVSKLQANVVEQCRATVTPFQGRPAVIYDAMSAFAGKKDAVSLDDMVNFQVRCIKPPMPKDRDGNGKISEQEWGAFQGISAKQFFQMDKNRDTFVTPRELDMFKKRYPGRYPSHFDRVAWDFNGDNRFSLAECESYQGLPLSVFNFLVQKAANTGKKELASQDIKLLKKVIRAKFPPKIANCFNTSDRNKDKKLSAREWHNPPFWNKTTINGIISMIGILCGLLYFFFSKEHKGVMGAASKAGVYFLMVCFGASFGYTVMARISLLIGRMIFLMKDWLGIL